MRVMSCILLPRTRLCHFPVDLGGGRKKMLQTQVRSIDNFKASSQEKPLRISQSDQWQDGQEYDAGVKDGFFSGYVSTLDESWRRKYSKTTHSALMLRDLPVLGQGGCSECGSKVMGVLLEGLTHDLGTVDWAGARDAGDKYDVSGCVGHLLPSQRDSGRMERYHVESRRMLRHTDSFYHPFHYPVYKPYWHYDIIYKHS